MRSPVVSVLVIAGTGRPYLRDALLSLIHQDFPDWEAIVIVSCSDPEDIAVVEAQIAEVNDASEGRIRVFYYRDDATTYPPYASRKWNFGLDCSRGKFIAFLDDDDMKDDGWLSAMVVPLMQNDQLVTTTCGGTCIDADGTKHGAVFGDATLQRVNLLEAQFITTGQLCIRKGKLVEIGGLDENLGCAEDYDLCLRLSMFPWQHDGTVKTLKRDTGSNACYHPDVVPYTQLALRYTCQKHGVIDDKCSRCRGPVEPLPPMTTEGGWHWRMQFNDRARTWYVLCGLPPNDCKWPY